MTEIETDVLVIGGGASGVSAATAAARNGLSAHLIEKNDFHGGRATASAVGTICGLLLRSTSEQSEFIHTGFPKEFAEMLAKRSGTSFEHNNYGLYYLPYQIEDFKNCCQEILNQSGVTTHKNTIVVSAQKADKTITTVTCLNNGETINFHPKMVIDCSGVSVISEMLGLEEIISDEYQSAAQVFGLKGIRPNEIANIDLSIKRAALRLENDTREKHYLLGLSVVPGSVRGDKLLLKMGLPEKVTNDTILHHEISTKAKEMIGVVTAFLKEHVAAFESAELDYTAHETGFRIGKRPLGREILTGEEVLNCSRFDDAIACGTWPVEIWKEGHKIEMTYFPEESYYQIGLRHLRSKFMDNLLFAGRHISADDQAIASARVIGTCLATGYAAGMASTGLIASKTEQEIAMEIQKSQFNRNLVAY